jgi:hypothetical protein
MVDVEITDSSNVTSCSIVSINVLGKPVASVSCPEDLHDVPLRRW